MFLHDQFMTSGSWYSSIIPIALGTRRHPPERAAVVDQAEFVLCLDGEVLFDESNGTTVLRCDDLTTFGFCSVLLDSK